MEQPMKNRHAFASSLATFGVALGLLAIVGCGGDGLPKRYQVSGKVTYKGAPVPKGTITFMPDDPAKGRAAYGEIMDGAYQLSTGGKNDGAMPGSYKIRIIAVDQDMSKVLANAGGGGGRQDDVYAAMKSAKRLIPAKYSETSTSGLTATVEEKSNTIDFPLVD
jgi:hypothetical protein